MRGTAYVVEGGRPQRTGRARQSRTTWTREEADMSSRSRARLTHAAKTYHDMWRDNHCQRARGAGEHRSRAGGGFGFLILTLRTALDVAVDGLLQRSASVGGNTHPIERLVDLRRCWRTTGQSTHLIYRSLTRWIVAVDCDIHRRTDTNQDTATGPGRVTGTLGEVDQPITGLELTADAEWKRMFHASLTLDPI